MARVNNPLDSIWKPLQVETESVVGTKNL